MPATLDRKFEKFLGGPTEPHETRVYVTLSPRSRIALNITAYKLLGKPAAVYLYFSRADDTIAIEPVESYRLPSAFPIKQNGGGFYISASPFCRHFGIKLDTTQRFISPEIRDGALQLKLSEMTSIKRASRTRKKRLPAISPLDKSKIAQII